jgi:hypothetical protein
MRGHVIDAGARAARPSPYQRADLGRADDLAVAEQRLAVAEVAAAVVLDREHERRAGDDVLQSMFPP